MDSPPKLATLIAVTCCLVLALALISIYGGSFPSEGLASYTGPVLRFSSPAAGTAISGNVELSVKASRFKIASVQYYIDARVLGAPAINSPYSLTLDTIPFANGMHTLKAIAAGTKGESVTTSIRVTIRNSNTGNGSSSNGTSGTGSGAAGSAGPSSLVYTDSLQAPWTDTSWGANNDFANTEQVSSGAAIKSTIGRWGGLRLGAGNGNTLLTFPSGASLSFDINGGSVGIHPLVLELERGAKSLPEYNYGDVPANTWVHVVVPLATLDPDGGAISSVSIIDQQGLSKRVMYVDNMLFTSGSITPPPTPTCMPGSLKQGTACLACNAAGSAYAQDQTRCTGGSVCTTAGTCQAPIVPPVNVTGNATGNATGNLTGNMTGNATDTGTGNSSGNGSATPLPGNSTNSSGKLPANIWVSAYLAGWMQGDLPPSQIDYSAVTHIFQFSIEPGPTGNLLLSGNGFNDPNQITSAVSAAHAAGKKIIITIGGAGDDFGPPLKAANRATFISNLVNFMKSNGYDGIDLDMEPIPNAADFQAFVPALKSAMLQANPNAILTIATLDDAGQVIAPVQQYFDQINIMTYDLSGAWQGWVTWHNSPIYNGGATFPSTGGPLPSIDTDVNQFIALGIPASKIGIGIDFYGYYWTGATGPQQSIATVSDVRGNVPYYELAKTYGIVEGQNTCSGCTSNWDASAQAAYLTVDNAGTANDKFVSYDSVQTVKAKVKYAKDKGIGGLIIWELGGGYRADQPAGKRDLLLQAIKG